MKILAYILLGFYVLEIALRPFLVGKKIEVSASSGLVSIIMFGAVILPICGRIIGWW